MLTEINQCKNLEVRLFYMILHYNDKKIESISGLTF